MNTYISKDINRFNYLLSETDAVYHDMSKRLGLSDSISQILYTICDLGDGCLLQEICRRCGLSKQTVNSAIRRLESDGCLYLEAAGARNKKAYLTDRGKALAERTAVKIIKAENEIFASWPAEDVARYLELTERYLLEIRKKAQSITAE